MDTEPFNATPPPWEKKLSNLWGCLDSYAEAKFIPEMIQLIAERTVGHAVALFEVGTAHDSISSPQKAVDHYKQLAYPGYVGAEQKFRWQAHLET